MVGYRRKVREELQKLYQVLSRLAERRDVRQAKHKRAPRAQEDSAPPEGWYRALLYAFAAAHWAVLLAGCAAAPHVHPLALLGGHPTQGLDAQRLTFFLNQAKTKYMWSGKMAPHQCNM